MLLFSILKNLSESGQRVDGVGEYLTGMDEYVQRLEVRR